MGYYDDLAFILHDSFNYLVGIYNRNSSQVSFVTAAIDLIEVEPAIIYLFIKKVCE